MKNQETNRINMINTSVTFCDGNTASTAGITAFATVLAAVKGKIVLINALNQVAGGTTKGVTLDTNALRKVMTDIALKCANATLAYANSISNNTLKALVNFTESKLNKLKKEDVDDVCQGIKDATNANIADVVNFGVAASDVTDLQTAIDLYRTATQNPRNAIITKSQANKHANVLVRDVIDNLFAEQMDKMVNTLKISNPVFCSGYKQAREIIDLGATTAKVRGVVKDEDDVPLVGVAFAILKKGTTEAVAKTETAAKGKFSVKNLPAGDFDFVWEYTGYETLTEPNVHISAGKELQRKVVMKRV